MKDLDIQFSDAPNENYQKLFNKFNEIETLDVSQWNVTHILGYFCKQYHNLYNIPYKFKFNTSAPSKCFEVFQIKKLSTLLTSQPVLLKEYIDWVFKNKVINAKKRLTSISFLNTESFLKEYKFTILLNQNNNKTIDRSTALLDKYKEICNKFNYNSIDNFGDLSFLFQVHPKDSNLENLFKELESSGLDLNILSKIV